MGQRQGAVENLVSGFWFHRPVLVTGASGLLGASLVRQLVEAKARVVALVRDWVPESELVRGDWLSRIQVVRGDVLDQALLERVLGEYEVDTVFHLAAQTIVAVANRNPVATLDVNIRGTWALLEATRRSPLCKQIVVASSDKAYGSKTVLPYTEEASLTGSHPYDVSKSCADLIAQMYATTYGLPVCITRCGNFYGPGDLNWNHIVPGTMRSAYLNERPVIRSDGKFVRDYIYVDDGALAYMDTARALAENRELAGEAFNFSNEEPTTVVELVQRILRVTGKRELEPEIRNEANHEIREQYLSAQKARTVLSWRPRFSIDEGLERTWHWYRTLLGESAS